MVFQPRHTVASFFSSFSLSLSAWTGHHTAVPCAPVATRDDDATGSPLPFSPSLLFLPPPQRKRSPRWPLARSIVAPRCRRTHGKQKARMPIIVPPRSPRRGQLGAIWPLSHTVFLVRCLNACLTVELDGRGVRGHRARSRERVCWYCVRDAVYGAGYVRVCVCVCVCVVFCFLSHRSPFPMRTPSQARRLARSPPPPSTIFPRGKSAPGHAAATTTCGTRSPLGRYGQVMPKTLFGLDSGGGAPFNKCQPAYCLGREKGGGGIVNLSSSHREARGERRGQHQDATS